jgi:hypothetical protein
MAKDNMAQILQFPSRHSVAATEPADTAMDLGEPDIYADGNLACAPDFDIDEPDPLLITEGRNQAATCGPQDSFGVYEGSPAPAPRRFMRLRDLHPIDIAIVTGFLLLTTLI